MDLVITPTFNTLVLLLLLCAPAGDGQPGRRGAKRTHRAVAVVPGQRHPDRDRQGAGPVAGNSAVAAQRLLTLAALGFGADLDWPRFALAAASLLLFGLWLGCITLFLSAFSTTPAALAASYGILLFLWLLDSLSGTDAPWYWFALLPHIKPWLSGLLRSQDIVFFVATAGAALLLSSYALARRRGDA